MTDTKWRSPTGHTIASDVTDKLHPKGEQNNDVQAALDVINKFLEAKKGAENFLPFKHSNNLSTWLSAFMNTVNYRLSYADWESLELVKRALAQQQPDAGLLEAANRLVNQINAEGGHGYTVHGQVKILQQAIASAEQKGGE